MTETPGEFDAKRIRELADRSAQTPHSSDGSGKRDSDDVRTAGEKSRMGADRKGLGRAQGEAIASEMSSEQHPQHCDPRKNDPGEEISPHRYLKRIDRRVSLGGRLRDRGRDFKIIV